MSTVLVALQVVEHALGSTDQIQHISRRTDKSLTWDFHNQLKRCRRFSPEKGQSRRDSSRSIDLGVVGKSHHGQQLFPPSHVPNLASVSKQVSQGLLQCPMHSLHRIRVGVVRRARRELDPQLVQQRLEQLVAEFSALVRVNLTWHPKSQDVLVVEDVCYLGS